MGPWDAPPTMPPRWSRPLVSFSDAPASAMATLVDELSGETLYLSPLDSLTALRSYCRVSANRGGAAHVALEVTVDRGKVVRKLAELVLVRADNLADLGDAQVAAGLDESAGVGDRKRTDQVDDDQQQVRDDAVMSAVRTWMIEAQGPAKANAAGCQPSSNG